MRKLSFLIMFTVLGCPTHKSVVSDGVPNAGAPTPAPTSTSSTLSIVNDTDAPAVVFVAFGADSVVLPGAWCTGSGLNCQFALAARARRDVSLGGQYLNATISFDKPVTCGTTKAELNLNNPAWYDTVDVSLVDGWNKFVAVNLVSAVGRQDIGPVGPTRNEKAFGVFPDGCDVCVARQNPPCGVKPGTTGCKSGTQYNPDVPCQWQGPTLGGGTGVTVRLLAGIPLK
jgi:hypothetical protein